MAWLSRNTFSPSDALHADDLNNLANDQRSWGGDVNGGGHHLSNVILDSYFPGGVGTALISVSHVIPATGDPSSFLSFDGAAPGNPGRWRIGHNNTAESTGNVGSDFEIDRYSDAGLILGTPFAIRRSDGLITMGAQKWTGAVDGGGVTLSNVVITGTMTDPTTTKGDLIVHGSATTRLGVGADGQVLTADSTQATGVKWAAASGGVVTVFGRSGTVVALAGDYTAAKVTNAVDQTGSYANPAWITSLPWAKITGAPALIPVTRQVLAGTGLSGGGALSADVTLAAIPMAASGASHAGGTVPDPGATLGATRYLREDATWAVPAGAGGGLTDPTTTKGDLLVRGSAAVTRLGVGTDGWVLTADSTQATGVKWAAATGGGGSQTPWTSDIDAASFKLKNVGTIAVGNTSTSGGNVTVQSAGGAQGFIHSDVAAPGGPGLLISNDAANAGGVLIGGSTYTVAGFRNVLAVFTQPAIPVVIAPNRVEVMRVTSSGRVGIGITAPAYPLDVVGDVHSSGIFRVDGGPVATIVSGVTLNAQYTAAAGGQGIDWSVNFSGFKEMRVAGTLNAAGNAGELAFFTNATVTSANGTEKMRITGSGRVGIGLSAPAYPLDVVGDINCTGAFRVNGGVIGAGGAQTPWAQNVDAAGFALTGLLKLTGSTGNAGVPILNAPQGASITIPNNCMALVANSLTNVALLFRGGDGVLRQIIFTVS